MHGQDTGKHTSSLNLLSLSQYQLRKTPRRKTGRFSVCGHKQWAQRTLCTDTYPPEQFPFLSEQHLWQTETRGKVFLKNQILSCSGEKNPIYCISLILGRGLMIFGAACKNEEAETWRCQTGRPHPVPGGFCPFPFDCGGLCCFSDHGPASGAVPSIRPRVYPRPRPHR